MPDDLLYPADVDARLQWPPGRAARMAARGRLPHYRLPDGEVRLSWAEVAALVEHVTPGTAAAAPQAVANG